MRWHKKNSRDEGSEVSWISMTDVFVVGCCILLLLAFSAQQRLKQIESGTPATSVKGGTSVSIPAGNTSDQASIELADTKRKLQTLQNDLDEANTKLFRDNKSRLSQQKRINNRLLGLGGKLENVAFMVDVSKSMRNNKGRNGVVTNNWSPAVKTIERWIDGLDVKAASLIVFGETAEVKVQMQLLDNGGREKILATLQRLNPDSEATNFLDAFRKVYQIPNLDTIMIFSDGLPSVDVNGKKIEVDAKKDNESDEEYARRRDVLIEDNIVRVLEVHKAISEMAARHPGVAINVIGLGAGVYSEKTGNLLNDLALNNGGIFLALPSENIEK